MSAEREEIVAALTVAFGEAEDVSPTETHDLHVLFKGVEVPPPWSPSPIRCLAIFANWPQDWPLFYVDRALVGETGEPPRSNHEVYHLDETWRGFSWNLNPAWRGDDPVRAIQLWINRFVAETT
jgi:hypothetical protein